jgi:predicted transcriptional regulator
MENNFMWVEEVAEELGVSKSYAYKIVRDLNKKMEEKGYLTISGRINGKYFMEKLCYDREERRKQ